MPGIERVLRKMSASDLENPDIQELNYWISCFVAEVRNLKGEPYP